MTLDPTKVPNYPVINLRLTPDGAVWVDGHPVVVEDGQPPTEAGVQAVATKVGQQGLGAVRVRAVTPDREYTMVVTESGDAIDTTPPPEDDAGRRRLPLRTIAFVAGAFLVLGAGGTATVMAVTGGEPPAPSVPSPTVLPGAGANLPVQAPEGYDQKAAWSVPVEERTQAMVTDGGAVLVTTTDGELGLLDGASGTASWTGRSPQREMHLSSVDGRPVVAAANDDALTLWPLDITDPSAMPGTELELAGRAEVSYLGSMPLIELPNQTVTMFDGAELALRDVPIGAQPVMTTPAGVIAVSADAWWTITVDAEPVSHPLPRPEAAQETAPAIVSAAADDQLVLGWPTSERGVTVFALIDLTSGEIRQEATMTANLRGDEEPIRDPSGTTMTLGSILVDYGPDPLLIDLGDIEPSAVNDRSVYGTLDDQQTTVEWDSELKTHQAEKVPGDVVPPIAVTDQYAYVITEKINETRLYALPRTEGMNP